MQLFDKFGHELLNTANGYKLDNYDIELEDVGINMLHQCLIYAVNDDAGDSKVSVELSTNLLKFFSVHEYEPDEENEYDAAGKLVIESASYWQHTAVASEVFAVPIAFVPEEVGKHTMSVRITIEGSLPDSIIVNIVAHVIQPDERLMTMMSNFGNTYLAAYSEAMLQADNRQDIMNCLLQNEKMREWIMGKCVMHDKLGTYAGLYAALDWLGYGDYVQIYEVLKDKLGLIKLIELEGDVSKWSNTFFRTNLLSLNYDWNHFTGEFVNGSRCHALPIIEVSDELPNQDTVKKLAKLVDVLEERFLPEHIHFIAFSCDVFAAFITMMHVGTQVSRTQYNYTEMPGAVIDVVDVDAILQQTDADGTDVAWIRPHAVMVPASSMEDATTVPNRVFEIAKHPIELDKLDAQEYIDWYIKTYGIEPAYFRFDRQSITLNKNNNYQAVIGIESNTGWNLQD